jgi:hypothetical protein
MFQLDSLGKWLVVAGVGIAVLGGLIWLASKVPGLNRLGSLPGDIHWQSANGRVSCFVPIVSMLLLSVILTVVLNVVIRLLNK